MAADTAKKRVNLDLDALDREHVRSLPPPKEPFTARIGGQELTFKDASEIDSLVLMTLLDTPSNFFKGTLSEDDYKHMMDVYRTPGALPGFRLRALMDGYQEYYGLDDRGNVTGSRR